MSSARLVTLTGLLLLWILHGETRKNRGSSPGQAWPFRESVIRAQCEANCLSRYGVEPSVDPNWLETYDVYVPLSCPEKDGPCTQCLNPCFFIFGTKEKCHSNCASRHCRLSCDKIHELLAHEQHSHDVLHSEFNIRLTPPTLTCQNVNYYGGSEDVGSRGGGGGGTQVYLRWDVKSEVLTQAHIPMAFVLEISSEQDGLYTNWTPFSGAHAWIPVSANLSTSYHFRVTPVLKDGQAGASRSSHRITTLPKRPKLKPPIHLRVMRQRVGDGQLYVTFHWTPSPDVITCHYELMLLPTGRHNVISNEATSISYVPRPRYEYGPLPYGTEYTARMSACSVSHRCTSDTADVTFTTISCLHANNHSYFLCEPERPADIHIIQMREYQVVHNKSWTGCYTSVEMAWTPPHHTSPSNPITAYILSAVKIPDIHLSHTFEPHELQVDLPANLTSYILKDLQSKSKYVLRLAAVSHGGIGPPDSLYINTSVPTGYCATRVLDVQSGAKLLGSDSSSPTVAIVAPILCIAATIAAIFMGIRYRRRLMKRRKGTRLCRNQMEGNPFYEPFQRGASVSSRTSRRSSGDVYEIDFSHLALDETLGQGAFGKVVKGRLNALPKVMAGSKTLPPMTVAVKMLKEFSTVTDSECLLQEIALMKTLGRHPNVVSLVACVTTSPHLALVMDYCSHGDLKMHLRKLREKYAPLLGCQSGYSKFTTSSSKKCSSAASSLASLMEPMCPTPKLDPPLGYGTMKMSSLKSRGSTCGEEFYGYVATDMEYGLSDCGLSPTQLLSYARQIAVGMEYLSQKKFIHRDLAARNILVCEDGLLKISDFGLTRDIYEHNVYHKQTDGKLPIKWMSIEAIFDQVYTTKSDVWSFGIVLWEIATLGGTPYPGISSGDIYRKLKEGYRMEKPDNCCQELYDIMTTCWMTDPDDRPDFTDLRSTLEKMMEQDEDNAYLSLEVALDEAGDKTINGHGSPVQPENTGLGENDDQVIAENMENEGRKAHHRHLALSPSLEPTRSPCSGLDTVRAESEPLLPSIRTSNDNRTSTTRISISGFSRRKGERVQNVYTDMKSQSKLSLQNRPTNETNEKNDGGLLLKPIQTVQRSKSSQDLGFAAKSHNTSSVFYNARKGKAKAVRHYSVEDLDVSKMADIMIVKKGLKEAAEGGGFVKTSLSEVTKEFLKYWLPERNDNKQEDVSKENDPMTFKHCQDVLELETRM